MSFRVAKDASVHSHNRQFLPLTRVELREEGFTMLKGGKGYTIADIEALPEGERAELIDGELFRMEAPTWARRIG